MGHGYWRSVVILWLWTALLSAFVLYPAYSGKGNGLVPILLAALGLGLYTWFRPARRNGEHNGGNGTRTSPDGQAAVDDAALDPTKTDPTATDPVG
jgi:UDP-GlcNAc:undecaprenyl-phosphate GlcNAc-1-phosphate transferase